MRLTITLIGLLTLMGCSEQSSQTESNHNSLVGSWKLHSWIATLPTGQSLHPFGEDVVGRIAYDDSGHMSVQIMRLGRPHFEDGDIMGGTSNEVSAAYHGYVAYYGSYEMRPSEGEVVHTLDASSFPNWENTEQIRSYRISGDTLWLSPPAIESIAYDSTQAVSAEHVLTWIKN